MLQYVNIFTAIETKEWDYYDHGNSHFHISMGYSINHPIDRIAKEHRQKKPWNWINASIWIKQLLSGCSQSGVDKRNDKCRDRTDDVWNKNGINLFDPYFPECCSLTIKQSHNYKKQRHCPAISPYWMHSNDMPRNDNEHSHASWYIHKVKSILFRCHIFLMNFAGFPPHNSFAGILRDTTLPAATTALLPMDTPFKIMECAPIKTLSPIITSALFAWIQSWLLNLIWGLMLWKSESIIVHPKPMFVWLPILIRRR